MMRINANGFNLNSDHGVKPSSLAKMPLYEHSIQFA